MNDDNSLIKKENDNKKTVLCVGMCVLDIVHVCNEFPIEDEDKRYNYLIKEIFLISNCIAEN